MKQLINYKITGKQIEEFKEVKLLHDREVLAEIPICVIEFGKIYTKAYINGSSNIPEAIDEERLQEIINKTRIYHLKVNETSMQEVEVKEADISVRLPIDTPVEHLVYDNGEIFLAKPIEKGDE